MGASGGSVAGDQSGTHLWISFCGFELAGHSSEEACEDQLFFYADDGVVRTGHAYVGLVGGAVGEDALVGGGDVGVGAEECGDTTVQIPAESDFFTRGFAVKIEENDFGFGFAVNLGEELVGFAKGVIAGGHEDASLKVHDGVGLAIGELALVKAEAGGAHGIVSGAEDAAAAGVGVRGNGHVLEDLPLVPDVVAGGD